jgi:diguanylate cyclase (GGDEF)-like protein
VNKVRTSNSDKKPNNQQMEQSQKFQKEPMEPKDRTIADPKHVSIRSSALIELLAVIVFAVLCTMLMINLEAFEKLYRYARSFELIGFGEIAVFLPSFLAIGFVLYSLRRIEELKSEIIRRRKAENKLQKSERMYKELSITDALTQLYNSRYFYSKLDEEIYRSVRYKHPLSLLLIDIDNFKALNDRYGHLEGDKVLSMSGTIIKDCLRKTDSAYRYGGEEFTVILPEIGFEAALNVAERIRQQISTHKFSSVSNHALHITVSIGACRLEPGEEMKALVKRADKAMYVAKRNGRNQVEIAEK